VTSVVWDGKDLASVQMLTCKVPRREGRPAAEVDADWNLTVLDIPAAIGTTIFVTLEGDVYGILRTR
jgi:hypothetical protein